MNRIFTIGIFLSLQLLAFSKNSDSLKTILIAPGPDYKAGWLHNVFFGSHWRDAWTTPIEVRYLNLNEFAGGLTPIKRGGGFQTKSLRFLGNDGKQWKFRSLDKDPSKILPEELQESLVADIIQDQISSSHPLAPLVVAPLLNAVGVLQAEPSLFMLPDSDELASFKDDFGGILGMIEVHPDEGEEDSDGFAGSDKVSGTFKLLDRLEEKRSEKIDAPEFLKARLMDIFLGDWDRHTDQWRWARFEENGQKLWKPIPRDRDQAFAKYDGVGPMIVAYLTPQLNHFGYSYPSAKFITWSGRFLDRRILPELTKEQWDSITAFVTEQLTDSIIISAVKHLPASIYEKTGQEITAKLLSRKKLLSDISNDFYKLTNEVVDIYASSKDDYVEIFRLNDDETELYIFKRDKQSGSKVGDPLYLKLFNNSITCEIRVHLLDGDDKIVVRGNVSKSPLIRIIAGDGKDEMYDSSFVSGFFLGFIPVPDAENKTIFYDSGKKSVFAPGRSTSINTDKTKEPENEYEKYEPAQIDRGSDFFIFPSIPFNSDDGFRIGLNPVYYSYNFRAVPYDYKLDATGIYATKINSYRVELMAESYGVFNNTRARLSFLRSGLSLVNYFGYGNSTMYDSNLESDGYFRLEQELSSIAASLDFLLNDEFSLGIGVGYNFSDSRLRNDILLNSFRYGSYGIGNLHTVSFNTIMKIDLRDNKSLPHKGYYFAISSKYFPEFMDIEEHFANVNYDLRGYISFKYPDHTTFAIRTGGSKNWGKYPFIKSVFLGGERDLRGFSRERFSGDAALFGQAELRTHLSDVKVILKGKLGLILFADAGKIFTKSFNSDIWHHSLGAGLFLSYLNRQFNFSLNFAYSKEKLNFYLSSGMMF